MRLGQEIQALPRPSCLNGFPEEQVTDASLKPDPMRKGSYYRRIEDIGRALDKLGVADLPPAPKFVAYYFGCEKLAHGGVGIVSSRPAVCEYHHRNPLKLNDIRARPVR